MSDSCKCSICGKVITCIEKSIRFGIRECAGADMGWCVKECVTCNNK